MKRLVIVCEGPTEQEFVRDVLEPHLTPKNIYVQYPLVKKSAGGIVPWVNLKAQILAHLKGEGAYVTTLMDYYGIPDKYEYPGWQESKRILDKAARLDYLESEMLRDVHEDLRYRFIPYYQLHEFEGLLFNNINSFESLFIPTEFKNKAALLSILEAYDNPELINDNIETAPSKRLSNLIEGYNKIIHGALLAENIGLHNLREKSPRFNDWISKLESI